MENVYNCRRDCCPSMDYDPETELLIITDDFGGKVKLSRTQFEELAAAYAKKFPGGASLNA